MQRIALMLIRFYQSAISRHLRADCRFYPTCSEYAILSIEKYGLAKGLVKSVGRILRCNPFCAGGIDFP